MRGRFWRKSLIPSYVHWSLPFKRRSSCILACLSWQEGRSFIICSKYVGGGRFLDLLEFLFSVSVSLLSFSLQPLFTISLHNFFTIPHGNLSSQSLRDFFTVFLSFSSQSLSWKYLFTTPLISRTEDSQRREPGFTARRLFWELAIFTNTTSSTGIFYFDVKR